MSLLVRRIVARIPLLRRAFSHHHSDDNIRFTLNDCPIPSGDWQEHHDSKTTKYNLFLGSSILCFFGTIGYIKSSGVVNFNYTPPKNFD